jgi:hypothetical protein
MLREKLTKNELFLIIDFFLIETYLQTFEKTLVWSKYTGTPSKDNSKKIVRKPIFFM